jgi:hypothetical protein
MQAQFETWLGTLGYDVEFASASKGNKQVCLSKS